eukprot:g65574.t1
MGGFLMGGECTLYGSRIVFLGSSFPQDPGNVSLRQSTNCTAWSHCDVFWGVLVMCFKGFNLFDQFLLETNRNPLPPTKEDVCKEGYIAETEVCKVSMMQEFATFLFKYLQNDDDPLSFYRPGTALQFLSAAKCGLEKLFQNHCFARHEPENVEDKSGDKDGWNAHVAEDAKTRNKYIRWRAYLNNLTQAVGRASELGQTQYQYVSFDTQFQCLAFDWAQDKVGKMKILHVYASRDSFVDCAFHSLAEYFWSTSGSSCNREYIFDELKSIEKESNSNKINALFKTYFDKCTDAYKSTPGLTSRSCRVGPANIIAEKCRMEAAIFRVTDRKAGKVLAGWNANEAAFAVGFEDLDLFNPHLAKYNKRYDGMMDNIITALFGNHGEHLHYIVQRALTAQWFRHASAYHRAYGENAPMLEHVLKATQRTRKTSLTAPEGDEARTAWKRKCSTFTNILERPLRKVASDAKWEQAREREREKKPAPSRKVPPMTNSLTSVSPWLRTSEKLKQRNAEQERKFKNFITQFDYRKFSGTNLTPAY